MAPSTNVIRTLTIRSRVEGADKTQADLKGIEAAHKAVANVTETSAKHQLSMEQALAKQERRFNSTLRAQQDFEKVQRQMNLAVAQNPALQERANRVLAMASEHFNRASAANDNFRNGMSRSVVAQQAFQSASTGSAGSIASMAAQFGRAHPVLLAFAAGAGLAVISITAMTRAANDLAERSGRLVDMSETLGFTTTQLQLLVRVGAEVGVKTEELNKGLEKFALGWSQLREGSGDLLKGLLGVDAALAQQLATARNAAEAWNIYARARARADESDRIRLDRAAFGRGGAGIGRVAGATDDAGGLAALRQTNLFLAEQMRLWDQLKDQSEIYGRTARDQVTSVFSDETLESQRAYNREALKMVEAAKRGDWGAALLASLRHVAEFLPILRNAVREFEVSIHIAASFVSVAQASNAEIRKGDELLRALEERAARMRQAGGGPLRITVTPQRESDQSIAARGAREIAFLGQAATAYERYQQRLKEISGAVAENTELEKLAGRARADAARQYNLDRMQAMVAALGNASTVTEQYNLKVAELSQKLAQGAISQDTFNRAVGGLQSDERLRQMRDTIGALGDSATESQRYQLRVAELQQQLDRGAISQDTFTKAVQNANPVYKQFKDTLEELGTTFASAMLSGKTATEALNASLKSVTATATNATIKNLISGDLEKAAISATVAIASFMAQKIFGGISAEEKQRQQQQFQKDIDTRHAAVALAEQTRIMGLAQGSQEAALAQFDLDSWQQRVAEIDAGGKNLVLLEAKIAVERQLIIDDFAKRAVEAEKQAEAERLAVVEDFNRKLNDVTGKGHLNQFADLFKEIETAKKAGVGQNLLDQFLGASAQKIVDDAKLTGDAFQALITAFPPLNGVVREFSETIEAVVRSAQELAQARQSLEDRLFNAGNDTSTLEGAVAAQERQFRRERLEEEAAGGELLNDIVATQLAERLQLEKSFHDRALEEAKRAAEQERQARQSLEDRLFNAGNDTSTLEGAVAAQERQFLRERLKAEEDGGTLLNDLLRAQAAERLQLEKSFHDRSLEEAKRAAEQEIEASTRAARTIVDYLNNLNTGADSSLSPSARLLAARNTYLGQLSLAQGGNTEAAASITQYAEAYRRAAQDRFASGSGYQDVRSQIINDLLNLPQVTSSTDAIVQAIRDSIIATEKTTTSVDKVVTNTSDIPLLATENGGIKTIATNTGSISSLATENGGIKTIATNTGGISSLATENGNIKTVATNTGGDTGGISQIVTNTGNLSQIATNTGGISSIATEAGNIKTIATNTGGISSIATEAGNIKTIATNTGGISSLATENGGIKTIATNTGSISSIATNTGGISSIASNTGNIQSLATETGAVSRVAANLGEVSGRINQVVTNTGALSSIVTNTGALSQIATATGDITTLVTNVGGASGQTLWQVINNKTGEVITNTRKTQESVDWAGRFEDVIHTDLSNAVGLLFNVERGTRFQAYYNSSNGRAEVAQVWKTGGLVTGPGTGTSDSIPAYLSNKEYVIRASAVEKFGVGFFDALNFGGAGSAANVNMPIVPSYASNDNGELRALRTQVAELTRVVQSFRLESGVNTMRVHDRVVENTDAVRGEGDTGRRADSQNADRVAITRKRAAA